jgi:hypothetical protein
VDKLKDWGALLTAMLALVGGAVAWGAIRTEVSAHAADLADLRPRVQQVQTDNAVLKEAVLDIRDTVHRIEGNK